MLYALSQYLQRNVLAAAVCSSSAQWYSWCLVSPETVEYVFVHVPHLYRPSPVDDAAAMTGLRCLMTVTAPTGERATSVGCKRYTGGGGGGSESPYGGDTAEDEGDSDECECDDMSVSAVEGDHPRLYQLPAAEDCTTGNGTAGGGDGRRCSCRGRKAETDPLLPGGDNDKSLGLGATGDGYMAVAGGYPRSAVKPPGW